MGVLSVASTTIVINGPPLGGAFSATPSNGFALATSFILTSTGWSDVDLPIGIGFGYYDER